jgi:hypothetical protein
MKKMRSWILCFAALLLTAPLLRAQDLSRYRNFSFGMSLTTVLKHTDQEMSDVKVLHLHPALIQEVTWWPPNLPGPSFQSDPVEQILFSFYDGELYKISVTYDATSTEGLTEGDMIKSISAKYGPPTFVALAIDSVTSDQFEVSQKPVASWADAQYSFNLVRSAFSDLFGLIICSKRVNAEAEVAIAEAAKLEQQEGPQRAADLQKKQMDDLEITRQKNQKSFRP